MAQQLEAADFLVKAGTLLDPTPVAARARRSSMDEDPRASRGTDPDAIWTRKGRQAHFGYKAHLSVDAAADAGNQGPDHARLAQAPARTARLPTAEPCADRAGAVRQRDGETPQERRAFPAPPLRRQPAAADWRRSRHVSGAFRSFCLGVNERKAKVLRLPYARCRAIDALVQGAAPGRSQRRSSPVVRSLLTRLSAGGACSRRGGSRWCLGESNPELQMALC